MNVTGNVCNFVCLYCYVFNNNMLALGSFILNSPAAGRYESNSILPNVSTRPREFKALTPKN